VSLLLAFLALTALGVLAGGVTGLAPGLHVNNVAAVVLATEASWAGIVVAIAPGAEAEPSVVAGLLACFLLATAVSHGIFEFIPSVFFGAPSEDTALAVLPGHRLLLQGEGARAVALAARGAFLGVLASAALFVPLRVLLADPVGLFDLFRPWTAVFIAGLLVALLVAEVFGHRGGARRVLRAAGVQALAGLLGLAVLRGPSGLAPEVALFPLFSGLFGVPGLVLSLHRRAAVLPQRLDVSDSLTRADLLQALRGSLAGAAVSWLPGLSGGAAAALASLRRRDRADPASYMVLLGAVSTSTAILSVTVLFIIGRARSGAAAAIRGLIEPLPAWSAPASAPAVLLLMLASALLAGAIVAPLAGRAGRFLASRWALAGSRGVSLAVLGILVVLVGLVTGPAGLAVWGVAGLVGAVPVVGGVRRIHLMASLLLPVLVSALAG